MDSLIGIVSALAPDHVPHAGHQLMAYLGNGDIEVKCGCSVRFTFLATQIAALNAPKAASKPTKVGGEP